MLTNRGTYEDTVAGFRWAVPERYNIGVDICDRWAGREPERLAIVDVAPDGSVRETRFGALARRAAQLAHALAGRGIGRGDRIGILLPQSAETAVAHVASARMGAVALPLFTLFGPEALGYRLRNSGARCLITDRAGAAVLARIGEGCPDLELVLSVEADVAGTEPLARLCEGQPESFEAVATAADDPALLIYTSGTTGNPKGALHAHRVLLGHLPGVEMSHDFLPQPGDRIWSPADWAWIGGLLDVMMPALHHGVPVVACRFAKFTGAAAFDLIEQHGIRNAFLPPTALKMMRQAAPEGERRVPMRSVASGGETLGAELIDWGRRAFGVTINEFYGQTECNMVVASCGAMEPPRPGAMGRPVPGHRVAVVDPVTGAPAGTGAEGAIAVAAPDPVMFLGYWNDAEATAAKFVTDAKGTRWLLTGDRGVAGEDGRLDFVGRDDDVISSGGYRIGPAEIEDCLLGHPAVRLAGVVGRPDPLRGESVAAFVQLTPGVVGSEALAGEIAEHVKSRLAAHEYPRSVTFLETLPLTATGKIVRAELRRMAAAAAGGEGGGTADG